MNPMVETKYYPFVDGLRGIAITGVIFVHCGQRFLDSRRSNENLLHAVGSGARGVQLFFLLSAFTLFSSLRQRAEGSKITSFYLRRAFRIIPPWILANLVYFCLRSPHIPQEPTLLDLLLSVTFLFGFTGEVERTLVPGAWSLFCEETFYFLLPFIASRIKGATEAARLTIGLTAIALIWYIAAKYLGASSSIAFLLPPSQWFVFSLGFVGFFVCSELDAFSRPSCLLIDLAVLLAWSTVVFGRTPGPAQFLSAPAVFLLFIAGSQPRSVVGKLTRLSGLRLLGRCSYSIYLFHWLLVEALYSISRAPLVSLRLSQLPLSLTFFAVVAAAVALSLLGGWLFNVTIEMPFIRLGRNMIARMDVRKEPA